MSLEASSSVQLTVLLLLQVAVRPKKPNSSNPAHQPLAILVDCPNGTLCATPSTVAMSRQAGPAPVLPPTPEDETDMAQLQPGSSRAKAIQSLDKANKDNGIVDDIVDTPVSPSSSLVLSRFEFEPGKGNEGTKVLMVEWDGSADSTTRTARGMSEKSNSDNARHGQETTPEKGWAVTWEGKDSHNVLAVNGDAVGLDSTGRRMYFLLPPGATIPSLVRITRGSRVCVSVDGGSEEDDGTADLWTKPMPAIYPASLGSDASHACGRGVLHTLWARQRLGSLAAEIEAEMKANSESIGLQIALQEHDWVSDHFGIGEPSGLNANSPYLPSPASPAASRFAMPRSPIGGKLGEKLKGLRLATSPAELAAALQGKFCFLYRPPLHVFCVFVCVFEATHMRPVPSVLMSQGSDNCPFCYL